MDKIVTFSENLCNEIVTMLYLIFVVHHKHINSKNIIKHFFVFSTNKHQENIRINPSANAQNRQLRRAFNFGAH